MSELPKGWVVCKFGDIARIRNGYAFKSSDFLKQPIEGHSTPLVKQTQLGEQYIDLANAEYLPDNYLVEYSDFLIKKDDVVIGMSGSIGKLCKYNLDKLALQNQRTGLIVQHVDGLIDQKYFWLFLLTVESILKDKSKGVGVQNVSGKEIEKVLIHLSPLNEQKRIVEKVVELFSNMDKGIECLKTAQTELKIYRQAVLKWAFEGKLTNCDVKEGELPEGWRWEKLLSIVERISDGPFGSNLKSSDYVDKGIRVIRLENIGFLEFKNEYLSFVTYEKYETIKRHTVGKGDIIFSSFIFDSIRAVILPDYIEKAINKADCFLIRTNETQINNKYLVYYFATKAMHNQLVNEIHGATRPRINTTQLKLTKIPFAPLEEQLRIVGEIESRLSVCDKLEESITQSLQQAESLRQSILKKAFEGKLVPQDPNDEPASVLLERIRAERAAVVAKKATTEAKNPRRKARAG